MKKLLSILLSILLVISLGACKTQDEQINLSGKAEDMNFELVPKQGKGDTIPFYKNYDEIKKLISLDQKQEALDLFNEMIKQVNELYDLHTVDNVFYSENVNDEYNSELYEQSYSAFNQTMIDLYEVGYTLADKYGDDFKNSLQNDWLYEQIIVSENLSDEVVELQDKITQIQTYYGSVMSEKYTYTVNVDGNDYTLSQIFYDSNCPLTYEQKIEAATAIYKHFNDILGDSYIELVKLENELAKYYGYENYPAYADKCIYCRDYDSSELLNFYAAIKTEAANYYDIYLDSSTFKDFNDEMQTISEIVDKLPQYAQNAFNTLIDNKLIVVGNDTNHESGAYSCTIGSAHQAIIYAHLDYDMVDIATIIHELGHSSESLLNGKNESGLTRLNIDVAEIHSTGLEALAIEKYFEVLDEKDANTLKVLELNDLAWAVIYGCIYDEWQREVFNNPDMSVDEINQAFVDISNEYGVFTCDYTQYTWTSLQHNFVAPMYYISYATSAVVAMQIYELSKTDRNAAEQAWQSIVESSCASDYMQSVKQANLIPFSDIEATSNIFKQILLDVDEAYKSIQ